MKSSLCTLFFLCFITLLQAQIVHIPDSSFKAALLDDVDFVNTNRDNEIQLSEARTASGVTVPNKGIRDLTGIEAFINLRILGFRNNNVTTADLRNLTKLLVLDCPNNQLTNLQIATNNTSLVRFDAQNNQLTSIDLTNALDTIKHLNLSHNQLTSIDLSSVGNNVSQVSLDHNQLTNIIFPTSSTRIPDFTCSHNQLTNLTIPIQTVRLDCSNNPMDSLWVTGGLYSYMNCDSSQLRYMSLVSLVDTLICSYNNLDKLNVNLNRDYNYIDCRNNNIDSIYSTNSSIKYLNASNNNLRKLGILYARNKNIFPLDATNNPDLKCIRTDNISPSYVNNAVANWTIDSQTSISDQCGGIWSSVATLPPLTELSVYPNPTTANIQLDLGQVYEKISINLYNSLGQEIKALTTQQRQQLELPLPKTSGIYFVKVQTEKGQTVLKVLKE